MILILTINIDTGGRRSDKTYVITSPVPSMGDDPKGVCGAAK